MKVSEIIAATFQSSELYSVLLPVATCGIEENKPTSIRQAVFLPFTDNIL